MREEWGAPILDGVRVVFVALGQEQLGIGILSAVLRRSGHETALVFDPALFDDRYYFDVPLLARVFDKRRLLADEIALAKPDLLAFSVLTPTYRWALDVAREAKARLGVPVVMGGVHPSAVPEVCLEEPCVDFVCVGEGEHAIVALCEALARGAHRPERPIPNLWWKDERGALVRGPNASFIQDLDALPFFDKELWEDVIGIGDHYLTMSSRGCPYRCTFCFNNYFARLPGRGGGKYVRQRSVEHQMRELLLAKERYGIRYVEFTDDIFTVNKPWIRDFTRRYGREIGVPFQCLVHPRYVDDEVARWLRDAGCVQVQMGVQSADEAYKRRNLLRMEKDADLERALEALARAGIGAKLDHMLGLPGEPLEAQELARALYAKYPPKRIQTFWLSYMPGIEMTQKALEDGVLTRAEVDAIERGETSIFRQTTAKLDEDAKGFYRRYEILFRLMSLLPGRFSAQLRAENVPAMSEPVAKAVSFALDLANALGRVDVETLLFAKHYARTALRQLPEVLLRSRAPRRAPTIRPPIAGSWRMPPAELPKPPSRASTLPLA